MLLCMDVGNTQIHAGFYTQGSFVHSFRINTQGGWSADQLGVFIRGFCLEKKIDGALIQKIAICSVVPSLEATLYGACTQYFSIEPLYVRPGIKMGIHIARYKNTREVGSDLIAGAVGAVESHPQKNLLVIDFGTATTIIAINKAKEFIAGPIVPGIKTQIASLALAAEQLVPVHVGVPTGWQIGSTAEAIQAGVYYTHVAGIRYLCQAMAQEAFGGAEYTMLGTGGYGALFQDAQLYDIYDDALVLKGLVALLKMNAV